MSIDFIEIRNASYQYSMNMKKNKTWPFTFEVYKYQLSEVSEVTEVANSMVSFHPSHDIRVIV
ncbi:MAG TPA: hypothetical protein DCL77_06510 [Prolixibacteraceae bacterium]|jgi:hypothetical protein|nr:hypothetical protein [Prolixibacteraceae bacterium]